MYEPGYRLNGAQEHLIVSRVSGIDAKEMYIQYALTGKVANVDLEPLSNPKPSEICCKLSPLVMVGKIKKIIGIEKIRNYSDVVSVNPSYNDGDDVTGEGTLKQIVCRFFIVSKNKYDLKRTIDNIQKEFKVINENGDNMLIGNFDTDIVIEDY